MNGQKSVLFLIVVFTLFVFLTGCAQKSKNPEYPFRPTAAIPTSRSYPAPADTETPSLVETEVVIDVHADYFYTKSTYKELIEQAQIIVTGSVSDTGWSYNSARMGNNIEEPVSDSYDKTIVYEVAVDQFLKGKGPRRFFISKFIGSAFALTPEELQQKVEEEDFLIKSDRLHPDQPYLMFLTEYDADYLYPEIPEGAYYQFTIPGLFEITEAGKLKKVEKYVIGDFDLPLDEVIAYIQNPELIPRTPTPLIPTEESSPYWYDLINVDPKRRH